MQSEWKYGWGKPMKKIERELEKDRSNDKVILYGLNGGSPPVRVKGAC
jgi:hypothetical protein